MSLQRFFEVSAPGGVSYRCSASPPVTDCTGTAAGTRRRSGSMSRPRVRQRRQPMPRPRRVALFIPRLNLVARRRARRINEASDFLSHLTLQRLAVWRGSVRSRHAAEVRTDLFDKRVRQSALWSLRPMEGNAETRAAGPTLPADIQRSTPRIQELLESLFRRLYYALGRARCTTGANRATTASSGCRLTARVKDDVVLI